MTTFTALIYDGNRQRLVAYECDSKATFEQHLSQQFGVYVCLWIEQQVKDTAG